MKKDKQSTRVDKNAPVPKDIHPALEEIHGKAESIGYHIYKSKKLDDADKAFFMDMVYDISRLADYLMEVLR